MLDLFTPMEPSLAREQGVGGFGLDGVREFLEWDAHGFRGCGKGNESRRFRAVRFHAGEFFVSCPFPVCAGVSVFVSIFRVSFPFSFPFVSRFLPIEGN